MIYPYYSIQEHCGWWKGTSVELVATGKGLVYGSVVFGVVYSKPENIPLKPQFFAANFAS